MRHSTETVTITELARNLASIIDRVRISSIRVSITRGTQTVAELSSVVQPGLTLEGLLDLLQHSALPEDERQRYGMDLKTVRASASVFPLHHGSSR